MKRIAPAHLPMMRQQGLVVDDLPDEVLVYDLERHKAHCLNRTAALVWRRCDGRTTASEIAGQLTKELAAPVNEELVWLAVHQLDQLHLLETSIALPMQFAGMSRRAMIRNIGIAAAVAVPLVTSIISPTPAEAATCSGTGQSCAVIACCPGHTCVSNTCT